MSVRADCMNDCAGFTDASGRISSEPCLQETTVHRHQETYRVLLNL